MILINTWKEKEKKGVKLSRELTKMNRRVLNVLS